MECASDKPGKMDKLLIKEHLNCPICLEVYKRPRSLSCLHTFCTECIASVIVKNAEQWTEKMEIECPVCRKGSPAPGKNTAPAEWAQELPLNYAIVSLLDTIGSENESESRVCDPCAADGDIQPVHSFCLDCRVYQCDRCTRRHAKYPICKDHRVVKVDEVTEETAAPLDFGKIEYCEIHPRKEIEFYCEDDDVLCCSTCAIVGHRPCQQVVEVTDLGRSLKQGDQPHSLLSQLGTLQTELESSHQDLETNVTELETQAVSTKQRIEDARNSILQQVNQSMDRMSSDCGQLRKEHTVNLQDQIFQKKSQLAAIASSSSLLASTLERGSDAQTFIAYHKIQQQAKQYELAFQQDQATALHANLVLDLDSALDMWKYMVQQLPVVMVEQTKTASTSAGGVDGVNTCPTEDPLVQCEIEKMPLVVIQERQVSVKPVYNRGAYLPDGRVVAADGVNLRFCLLDNACGVTADIKLESAAEDIATVGDSEVVVSLSDQNVLQFLMVGDNTITPTKTVQCSRHPVRLCAIGNQELGVAYKTGFGIIGLDGGEKCFIEKDSTGRPIEFADHDYMTVDVGVSRVYQSRETEDTVYAFGFTGEAHFTYRHADLREPSGIALDRDRNAYICSYSTNTVHQISAEGDLVRVIETEMTGPYVVFFNSTGDRMMVINNGSDQSRVMQLRPKS